MNLFLESVTYLQDGNLHQEASINLKIIIGKHDSMTIACKYLTGKPPEKASEVQPLTLDRKILLH